MKTILILMFCVTCAWAKEDFFGEAILIRGNVLKAQGGIMKPVTKGTLLYKGEILKTQEKSFVKIKMVDDTVLSVGALSEVNFQEFDFTDKHQRSLVFELVKGQLAGDVKNKIKNGSLTFKTKIATLGVRGTQILMNHQSSPTREISEFALLEGRAVVTDEKNESFDLKKFERFVSIVDPVKKTVENLRGLLGADESTKYRLDVEETEANEFLPFYNPASNTGFKAPESLPLEKFPEDIQTVKTSSNLPHDEREANKAYPKKTWKQNLHRLNEKLKENQTK